MRSRDGFSREMNCDGFGYRLGMPKALRKQLKKAARFGLDQPDHREIHEGKAYLLSCGSDHHGHGSHRTTIGEYALGADQLRPLLRRLNRLPA